MGLSSGSGRVECFCVLSGEMGLLSLFRDGHELCSIGELVIDDEVFLFFG